ncbi:MAG: GGDEF domain-containing protein [Bradymonadia bacterium]
MEPQHANHAVEDVEQLGKLLNFADVCTQSLEIDTVLARASATIIEWGLADAVGIAFPEGMLGSEPVLHVSSGTPLVSTSEQQIHSGLLEGLVETGLCHERPERYRCVPGPSLTPIREAVRQDQAFTLFRITLGTDDVHYATLTLYGFQDWILSPRSIRLIKRAAMFLGRALQNALCLIDLERSTTEDHLTGALNRRGYERSINQEFERARRARRHVALILIDVDHFKQINDTHGHPLGDEVLVSIVAQSKEALRCSDIICRLGGDEFAIILPEVGAEVAAQVARRVAESCQSIEIEGTHITLSMGVAAFQPDWSATPELLLEAADQALYASKRNGRAQVSL